MDLSLVIAAFVAGLFTFLAPCTLPLVPGYLGLLSGVTADDLQKPAQARNLRKKALLNGLFFVLGFSFVFVGLGSLVGMWGYAIMPYRRWVGAIGGFFVVLFGLFMMNAFSPRLLKRAYGFNAGAVLGKGKPAGSFALGLAFGSGWTPCIGPILGSILLLASTSATVFWGAVLLFIFSMGVGLPFLLIAFSVGSASKYIFKFMEIVDGYRVFIMIFFGLALGVLLNPVFLTPGALKFLPLDLRFEGSILPTAFPKFIIPLLASAVLALVGFRKRLDPVSTIGGLFFVYLGFLLVTDNLGLLVFYGYELLRFINYDALIDYL